MSSSNASVPTALIAALAPGTGSQQGDTDWSWLLSTCVQHLPGVDAGSVLLVQRDDTLRFAAAEGAELDTLASLAIPPTALVPSGPSGVLLGFRIDDDQLSPAQQTALLTASHGKVIGSSMSVAIRQADQMAGYLQLDAFADNAFGEEQIEVAAAVGELVSARLTRHELERQLALVRSDIDHYASRDPVTGLANRSNLLSGVGRAIAQDRRSARTTALVLVQVTDLARLHGAFGRERGDDLLRHVAARLAEASSDVDAIAHLGAGTFGILAAGIDAIDDVETLIDSVHRTTSSPFTLGDAQVRPLLAIGVALAPTDADRERELLRCAELALARAANSSDRPVAWFMHDVDREHREHSRLAEELQASLLGGQDVWVAFQPVHRMSDGGCVGIEALARWDRRSSPSKQIPPTVFEPLAEELGLTHVLNSRVYDRAFSVFSSLDSVRGNETWRLGLNVSTSQLTSGEELVDEIQALSEKHDVPFEELDVEVAASIVFEATAPVLRQLRALREQGIRIVVDDFGGASEQIDRLEGLPIDALKIHPRWSQAIHEDEARRRVDAILSAARRLGLAVIAEGVETPDQAQHLADAGLDVIQGFAVTPPMHAAALLAYLSTRSLLD